MITEASITADIEAAGLDWITSLRAPAIKELLNSGALQLIPTALGFDLRPIAGSDRGYHLGFRHERFPGIAAGIDDGVVGVPHAVA